MEAIILEKEWMDEKEKQTARLGLVIYFAVLMAGLAFIEWKILQTHVPVQREMESERSP